MSSWNICSETTKRTKNADRIIRLPQQSLPSLVLVHLQLADPEFMLGISQRQTERSRYKTRLHEGLPYIEDRSLFQCSRDTASLSCHSPFPSMLALYAQTVS